MAPLDRAIELTPNLAELVCVRRSCSWTSFSASAPYPTCFAVVDAQLRVHGLQALRVIDSSIMPKITGGNTTAPSIMTGEKGADMVKTYWNQTHASTAA